MKERGGTHSFRRPSVSKDRGRNNPTSDLLNLEFLPDVSIADSMEVDGIVFDYAADRRIVAREILDASKRTTTEAMNVIDFAVVKSAF
jgi:uncharacterized protein YuzE